MKEIFSGTTAVALALMVIAVLSIPPQICRAQTEPFTTTYISINTRLLRGVRQIGMGGVGVSETGMSGTGYYNPASLAWNDAIVSTGSYYDYLTDIGLYEAAISGFYLPGGGFGENIPWEGGLRFGWAISYWALRIPAWEERTIYMPEGSSENSGQIRDYYLTGSFAAAWKRGIFEIGGGGAAKYLEIKGTDFSLWSFDLGLVASASMQMESGILLRPRIGLSAADLGSGFDLPGGGTSNVIKRYRVGGGADMALAPVRRLGWKLDREVRLIGLSVSYDMAFDDAGGLDYLERSDMRAFGFEIELLELFRARMGMSDNMFINSGATTFGLGLGWEGESWMFSLDYARVEQEIILKIPADLDNYSFLVGWRR